MKSKKVTNIHVERARHGINQSQLAKATGISRQTIHAIENGKWVPNIRIGLKIAGFFKVSIEYLFTTEHYKRLQNEKGNV